MGNEPVLEMRGISKRFPGVQALDSIDFTVNRNEIVGLVGENGAGKSTLMKILIGLYKQDAGELRLRNEIVDLIGTKMAVSFGVGMVFQEGSLVPNLTVAENLFLGHEKGFRKKGFLSQRKMNEEARRLLEQTGTTIDPKTFVQNIPAAERQMIEITRLLWVSRISGVENPLLILDEPTTVLLAEEIEQLFDIMRELKKNSSIIFISHRLEEVLGISDRIVIFRNGKNVDDIKTEGAKISEVEQLMVGRALAEDHYKKSEQNEPGDDVCLRVHQLEKTGSFVPVNFTVRKGDDPQPRRCSGLRQGRIMQVYRGNIACRQGAY